MDSSEKLFKVCKKIIQECVRCNKCISECKMLQQIGEDPTSICKRQPSVNEAYSCSLCGLCEAVCPLSLSMREVFAVIRENAVENQFIPIDDFRYMFPDRPLNVMNIYREVNGIKYDDLSPDQKSSIAFFPGCTMLTYSPQLTRTIYSYLKEKYQEITLLTDCCGIPLFQLGLTRRGNDYVQNVKAKLQHYEIETLISACPNCYYQLRKVLEDTQVNLVTVYEALDNTDIFNKPLKGSQLQTITIHDSCPDRFEGIFAGQVRKALTNKGFNLAEMEHSCNKTLCCGSGGQVTHFSPDLAEQLVKERFDEAEKSGAGLLISYCMACVLNFARIPSKLKIQHALNLILEIEEDYTDVKNKARSMFAGPEGEKYWEMIMAD